MEYIKDRIIEFGKNNKTLADDNIGEIFKLLIKKYDLSDFDIKIKEDWIPIVPGDLMSYEFLKKTIHFYTYNISRNHDYINGLEDLGQDKYLFLSALLLKEMLHVIEHVIQINIKSINSEDLESYILYLCFKHIKELEYLNITHSDDYNYIIRKYTEISPFERLAEYYAYDKVTDLFKGEKIESRLRDYNFKSLNNIYQFNENPTTSYIRVLLTNDFISEEDFNKFLRLESEEKDPNKRFILGLKK